MLVKRKAGWTNKISELFIKDILWKAPSKKKNMYDFSIMLFISYCMLKVHNLQTDENRWDLVFMFINFLAVQLNRNFNWGLMIDEQLSLSTIVRLSTNWLIVKTIVLLYVRWDVQTEPTQGWLDERMNKIDHRSLII